MKKLWILIAILCLTTVGFSTTYYVSQVDGNDSYNGLYQTFEGGSNGPWLTIAKVEAESFSGDDNIYFNRGGTWVEDFTFSDSGSSGHYITIGAYGVGTKPIIDGEYTLPGGSVYYFLIVINGSYVKFQDFIVKRSSGSLVAIGGSGDYSQLLRIDGDGSRETGMVVGGDQNLIDECTMTDNGNGIGINGQETWGSAICTVGSSTTIQNCIACDNRGEGINAYSSSSDAIIQDNISYDNQSYNLYIDSAQGVTVRKNLIYQTKPEYVMNGITLGAETGQPSNALICNNLVMGCRVNFEIDSNVTILSNVEVVYNTFVNSVGGVVGYDMGVLYRPDINTYSDSIFKNNIVIEEDGARVPIYVEDPHVGLTFSYNCWNKAPIAAAQGAGDVTGDPKITEDGPTGAGELTGIYFKLESDSPCIEAADPIAVDEDYFETDRDDTNPDIGGHEYIGGAEYEHKGSMKPGSKLIIKPGGKVIIKEPLYEFIQHIAWLTTIGGLT